MSEMPRPDDPLTLEQQRCLNQACDHLEAAWKAGERPRIEDYLDVLTGRAQLILLRELIRLDIYYRRQVGDSPVPADYRDQLGDPLPSWLMGVCAEAATVNTKIEDSSAPEPPSLRDDSLPTRGQFCGAYELLEEIGRGGMGVVFKARQVAANRIVALKMIRSGTEADTEEQSRFKAEAEAAARLQHPHIVQVFEVGEHEGQPFFSLEFCPGGGLDRKLSGTPLPANEAAALLEKLSRAMEHAHAQGPRWRPGGWGKRRRGLGMPARLTKCSSTPRWPRPRPAAPAFAQESASTA
jgi:hypothetical protein